MKLFISVDAEGCSGLSGFEQVEPGSIYYSECRETMARDLLSVIKGAVTGGADHIVVCDAHERGRNLPLLLETVEGCTLEFVRGTGGPLLMMQGIDESFDAAMFIGYHARCATDGVMSHTYYMNCVCDAKINGKSVGEFGLNAQLASHFAVPAVMVTGDEAVCAEALEICPNIRTVPVKLAQGSSSVLCYDDTVVQNRLTDVSYVIASKFKKNNNALLPECSEIELTFRTTAQADAAGLLPGSERLAPDRLRFVGKDYREVFTVALVGMRLANAEPS